MNEQDNLTYLKRPDLRSPYMICGFSGSVNSGNVSAGTVNFFLQQFQAEKFAEIPTSLYHIYQVPGLYNQGPVFKMQDGLIVDSEFPSDQLFYVKNAALDHDLILFSGSEPNLNWEGYTESLVKLAREMGVTRLCTIGGLLEETPYTREPHMTCTCTSLETRNEMEQYKVLLSNRAGPATFNQMLLYTCQKRLLDGFCFNVRVPYYSQYNIGLGNSPRSIKAVLVRLNHIFRLDLDYEELDKEIAELHGKLDFVRQQNPAFNSYIEELEREYQETLYHETLDVSASEAIRFAEELLKENRENP